jgi:hypothetical protein
MKQKSAWNDSIFLDKRVILFALLSATLGVISGKLFFSEMVVIEKPAVTVVAKENKPSLVKLDHPVVNMSDVVGSEAKEDPIEEIEIYQLSGMLGYQSYFASHIKPEGMKDPKKIDDQDRAALMGAIGKVGVQMPLLPEPLVMQGTTVQPSILSVMTLRNKDGSVEALASNEHKGGKDTLSVVKSGDALVCTLCGEGVIQVYTIHLNVTYPDGDKLLTMQTTRNRPLGVSTLSVCGRAKLLR